LPKRRICHRIISAGSGDNYRICRLNDGGIRCIDRRSFRRLNRLATVGDSTSRLISGLYRAASGSCAAQSGEVYMRKVAYAPAPALPRCQPAAARWRGGHGARYGAISGCAVRGSALCSQCGMRVRVKRRRGHGLLGRSPSAGRYARVSRWCAAIFDYARRTTISKRNGFWCLPATGKFVASRSVGIAERLASFRSG